MDNIELQNKEIIESINEIAKNLLKENEVDYIIGYSKGTVPLSTIPFIAKNEKEINNLIWNNLCYMNLAKYLLSPKKKIIDGKESDFKVGIVSKGCVARAIIHLAMENQINLKNIKIIGIPCNGIINRRKIEKEIGDKEIQDLTIINDEIVVEGKGFKKKFPFYEYLNELCKSCKIKSPPLISDLKEIIVGDAQEINSLDVDFKDISEYESKTPEQKWEYIRDLLKDCIRCYACREACPMCYCRLCFIDQNMPVWFGKTTDISDVITFHLVRALHVAGRCVECGSCSSVCPMGIDLNLITRKLKKIAKGRFNFISGINLIDLPPMMCCKIDDSQEFMLEEK